MSKETSGFVRELANREIGEFPKLGQTTIGAALPGSLIASVDRHQMIASTEIFHELHGQVAGHSLFPSLSFSSDPSTHQATSGDIDRDCRQLGRLLIRSMTAV